VFFPDHPQEDTIRPGSPVRSEGHSIPRKDGVMDIYHTTVTKYRLDFFGREIKPQGDIIGRLPTAGKVSFQGMG